MGTNFGFAIAKCSPEHLPLSSAFKHLTPVACSKAQRWHTCHSSPVTRHFLGGVAERLNAPVLKTGRPKGLVSSNLTPSATKKNIANVHDQIADKGMHLPKIRTQFDRPAWFAPTLKSEALIPEPKRSFG